MGGAGYNVFNSFLLILFSIAFYVTFMAFLTSFASHSCHIEHTIGCLRGDCSFPFSVVKQNLRKILLTKY